MENLYSPSRLFHAELLRSNYWNEGANGRLYRFFAEPKSYGEAMSKCADIGASLARVDNDADAIIVGQFAFTGEKWY